MRLLWVLTAFTPSWASHAQLVSTASVEAYPISIGWDRTTVLVFPYEVVSADFGSAAVLGEKDAAAPNVLKVKAGVRNFGPTSMYVITADEKLYPFEVCYLSDPDTRPIVMGIQNSMGAEKVQLEGLGANRREMEACLNELTSRETVNTAWGKRKLGIRLGLSDVFERDGMVFVRLRLENSSGMDYVFGKWGFGIRDKTELKRTAVRNIPLEPLASTAGEGVPGNSDQLLVFAFPRISLSGSMEFQARVTEKNGGRNMELSIPAKKFLRPYPFVMPI